MPTIFEWIAQPLLLSIAQVLIPSAIPGIEDAIGQVTGGIVGEPTGQANGVATSLSPNGKAALAAILGTGALAAVGVGYAANQLSHTRITIREEVDGGRHSALEALKDPKVQSIGAALALAGLLASTQLLPQATATGIPGTTDEGQTPATGDWWTASGGDIVALPIGGTSLGGGTTVPFTPTPPIPPATTGGGEVGGGGGATATQ